MSEIKQIKKPAVMRGSIVLLSRKCGRKNCRCAQGEPHQGWALSSSLKGKTKMLTLPEKNLPEVKAALQRYDMAMKKLEREAMAGIERMRMKIRRQKKQDRAK